MAADESSCFGRLHGGRHGFGLVDVQGCPSFARSFLGAQHRSGWYFNAALGISNRRELAAGYLFLEESGFHLSVAFGQAVVFHCEVKIPVRVCKRFCA